MTNVALVTACIAPTDTRSCLVTDPVERLKEYTTALQLLVKTDVDEIYFVDSSGYTITELINMLSFIDNDKPIYVGAFKDTGDKTLGEDMLVSEGLKMISNHHQGESDVFIIKMTGRLKIPKLTFDKFEDRTKIYFPINKYYDGIKKAPKWLTFLFAFPLDKSEVFLNLVKDEGRGNYEYFMNNRLKSRNLYDSVEKFPYFKIERTVIGACKRRIYHIEK